VKVRTAPTVFSQAVSGKLTASVGSIKLGDSQIQLGTDHETDSFENAPWIGSPFRTEKNGVEQVFSALLSDSDVA
jgi:hypothetical protein